MAGLVLRTLATACTALALASCSDAPAERGAVGVEATLLAPCCFNGTLDTHESDLARTLRAEIEERVVHGEPMAAIQASMVERYGPRVLAMPNERHFGVVFGAAALVAALVLAFALFRLRGWLRTDAEASAPPRALAPRDAYDARIDADLDELE